MQHIFGFIDDFSKVYERSTGETFVVSDSCTSIQTTFNNTLYREVNLHYELAMVNLESFVNILEGYNNSFKRSVDDGITWTTLNIPTDCNELNVINVEMSIHGNSDITILPNLNTLQCISES